MQFLTSRIAAKPLVAGVLAVMALVAVVAGVVWISRALDDGSEEGLDEYFLRDVATVEAMGLPVYWLGTEFTVDGLVFRGPHVAEFGAEVQGGGVRMSYLLEGGNTPVYLTVYSRDAWE